MHSSANSGLRPYTPVSPNMLAAGTSSGWASTAIWNEQTAKYTPQTNAWQTHSNKVESTVSLERRSYDRGMAMMIQPPGLAQSPAPPRLSHMNYVPVPAKESASPNPFGFEFRNAATRDVALRVALPKIDAPSLRSTIKWTFDMTEEKEIIYNGRNLLDLANNIRYPKERSSTKYHFH